MGKPLKTRVIILTCPFPCNTTPPRGNCRMRFLEFRLENRPLLHRTRMGRRRGGDTWAKACHTSSSLRKKSVPGIPRNWGRRRVQIRPRRLLSLDWAKRSVSSTSWDQTGLEIILLLPLLLIPRFKTKDPISFINFYCVIRVQIMIYKIHPHVILQKCA